MKAIIVLPIEDPNRIIDLAREYVTRSGLAGDFNAACQIIADDDHAAAIRSLLLPFAATFGKPGASLDVSVTDGVN
ncbi:hypothetical protein GOB57_24670 [Sinorhizobium meliloti]|nr:hypothetical protein [Sinorhizobium meliloti]